MFSDASSFTVRLIHLNKHVQRKEGARFLNSKLIFTFKSGYVSLSVWGGLSMKGGDGLGSHLWFSRSAKVQGHSALQRTTFAYFKHGVLDKFVFQQDGCSSNRAKSIKYFLDAESVRVLPWPALSPDPNPIQNV